MSIYRGAGGAGDAVADSSSEALLVRNLAIEAQADADSAAVSAAAASTSASNASTSASNASTSATNAANSAASINLSSINITGGTITGITDLTIADGGTGASTASTARTNLGLGTAATTASTDYATAAQGTKADNALTAANPNYTGTLTGGTGVVNLGSGQFYKDASGNIGIGTTSPYSLSGFTVLDVKGTATNSGGIIRSTSANGTYKFQLYTASAEAYLYTDQSIPICFYNAATERMRINSGGNVLIGTATANLGSRFEVKSSNNSLAGFTDSSTYGTSYFVSTNGSGQVNHYATYTTTGVNCYHAWWTTTSGGTQTQALTLNNNGALALSGASTSATGVGITFPATQSASSDANTLDDYEEGTWTPSVYFGGGTVGVTYNSARAGFYTKVGSLVTASCYIPLTNKGSSTGQVSIEGLPFNNGGSGGQYTVGAFWTATVTNSGTPAAYVNPNATAFVVGYIQSSGTFTQFTNTNFANTSEIMITISYRVV